MADVLKEITYTPYVRDNSAKDKVAKWNVDFPKFDFTQSINPTSTVDKKESWKSNMTPTESVYTPRPTITSSVSTTSETPTVTRGRTIFKTEGIDIGKMQELIDKFNEYGINLRVTSGLRPGSIAASGRPSRHGSGEAIDITPIEGETFESLKEQLKKATALVEWMKANGYGILDETTPDAMKKNKSTGAHWHIGKDSTIQDWWKTFFLRQGGVLKKQYGGWVIGESFNRDNQPRLWEGAEIYQRQYSLPQGQGVIKQEYLNESEPPKKDWHDKLYNFTKSYETFQPNTYEAEGQNLIGYGTADKAYVSRGTITEKEASDKMKADFDYIETRLKKRIKNWNKLSDGTKVAIMDIAYNGKGVENFIENSPNLMGLLDSGITDGRVLAKELNHSVTRGGWLQARARARQAMAAGDYDWDSESVDKYGRQTIAGAKPNPNDWYNSPYYNYTI